MTTHRAGESDPDWWAVQVWSGREFVCQKYLTQRGYDVFLPHYVERRRWSDRVMKVDRPLFDGYLFCRHLGTVAGTIVSAPGVIRIVGDREGPLGVARHEIEAIRRVVDSAIAAEPWEFLEVGQSIRIAAGPLCGLEGIIQRVHNRHRLVLSVSILKRSVSVEVDPSWVNGVPHWIGTQLSPSSES